MRTLLLISLITALASCNLQKRCAELYPPRVDTSVHVRDSVIKIYEVIDLEVPVYIPRDSTVIRIKDSLIVSGGKVHITSKGQYVHGSLTVSDGFITARCDSDSLKALLVRVQDTLTHTREVKQQQLTITKTISVKTKVPTPFIPKIFWVLLAFTVIRLYLDLRGIFPNALSSVRKLFGK